MPQTPKIHRFDEQPPRLVFLRDLEIMASVGIFEIEHRHEQRIILGLEILVTETYDGVSERIADVLDYSVVARDAEALCRSRHFKLIETMAEALASLVLADTRVQAVTVRVQKPDVLPNCRTVGIELQRRRSDFGQV